MRLLNGAHTFPINGRLYLTLWRAHAWAGVRRSGGQGCGEQACRCLDRAGSFDRGNSIDNSDRCWVLFHIHIGMKLLLKNCIMTCKAME